MVGVFGSNSLECFLSGPNKHGVEVWIPAELLSDLVAVHRVFLSFLAISKLKIHHLYTGKAHNNLPDVQTILGLFSCEFDSFQNGVVIVGQVAIAIFQWKGA
jgi:hypothetical protein